VVFVKGAGAKAKLLSCVAPIEEAIRWHGGEAERSRVGFERLGHGERDDLIAFLRSL